MDSPGSKVRFLLWRKAVNARLAWCVGGACGGALLLLATVVDQFGHATAMHGALAGAGMAAAATAVGTVPVLLSQQFSKRAYDCFLGFGAGIMLAATAFSLIVPALAAAAGAGAGKLQASATIGAGVVVGALLIMWLDHLVGDAPARLARTPLAGAPHKRAWMFVTAVTLHNLPEGLAIGVAYAGPDLEKANSLATGIAIQDVPEGLVVALTLRGVGYGRLASAAYGVASGLIEPVAAALGVALIGIAAGLLPLGLAAAAGAMLFVIVNDVIPASHANGNGVAASAALISGFVVMTILDTALG